MESQSKRKEEYSPFIYCLHCQTCHANDIANTFPPTFTCSVCGEMMAIQWITLKDTIKDFSHVDSYLHYIYENRLYNQELNEMWELLKQKSDPGIAGLIYLIDPSINGEKTRNDFQTVSNSAFISDREKESIPGFYYHLQCQKCEVWGRSKSYKSKCECPQCGNIMHLKKLIISEDVISLPQTESAIYNILIALPFDHVAQQKWLLLQNQDKRILKLLLKVKKQYDNTTNILSDPYLNSVKSYIEQYVKLYWNNGVDLEAIHKNLLLDGWNLSREDLSEFFNRISSPSSTSETKTDEKKETFQQENDSEYELLEKYIKKVNSDPSLQWDSAVDSKSVLKRLGYTVGKISTLTETDRHRILIQGYVVDNRYINEKLGAPMSETRISKIISFLKFLNKSEESRWADYSMSIEQRNEDILWLERNKKNFMSFLLIEIQKYN